MADRVLRTAATDADEAELLTRLRAGDDAAFTEVVREQSGRLLAFARRILRHEDDARDALQEAFFAAFRGLAGFTGEARLATWLHRIVVNTCLMRLRARRRRPEDSIDELLPRFAADGHREDPGGTWVDPTAATIDAARLRQTVRDSIDRLPDSYRLVLLLRDIEEYDTETTAQLLDVSPNAVKIRLHRARQALRTLLDPHLARS